MKIKKMPNIPSLTIVKTTLSKMEKGGERLWEMRKMSASEAGEDWGESGTLMATGDIHWKTERQFWTAL